MIPDIFERPESTDGVVVREIWQENVYHLTPADFARGGVAVDVGANIGAFSLFCASLGARRVIACEPEEDNYQSLLKNLERNPALRGVVEPVQLAVWSHAATLGVRSRFGGAHVVEQAEERREVAAVSLDELFAARGIDECEVLKLDVEGAEYPIFRGLSTATQDRCRRIVLEFHPAPDEVFGRLIAQLTRTHKMIVLGSVDRGGYIWADRY